MSQRYSDKLALDRMLDRLCPECGRSAETHSPDDRFWVRSNDCSLMPRGVTDRIEQYFADVAGVVAGSGDQHE